MSSAELSEMLRRPAHPDSLAGWWCKHPTAMRRLIPHLVSPSTEAEPLRRGHLLQVTSCRACAYQYHLQLEQWRRDPDAVGLLCVPSEAAQQTVETLHADDAARLLAVLAERPTKSRPDFRALRLLQREALFEVLASARLAQTDRVVRAVDALFRAYDPDTPVLAREAPPPCRRLRLSGLLALALYATGAAQAWARGLLGAPDAADAAAGAPADLGEVLGAALARIASGAGFPGRSDRESVANGVIRIMGSCPRDALDLLSHAGRTMRALVLYVVAGAQPQQQQQRCSRIVRMTVALVRRMHDADFLNFWDLVTPIRVLRADVDSRATPQALLQSTQHAFRRARAPAMKMGFLQLYDALVDGLPSEDFAGMPDVFTAQLDFLLELCAPAAGSSGARGADPAQGDSALAAAARTVAARVVLLAYQHSAPVPPFRDSRKLALLLRALLGHPAVAELFEATVGVVLLTDACNLLRAVHGHKRAAAAIHYLAKKPPKVLTRNVLDITVYELPIDLVKRRWSQHVPFMQGLWRMLGSASFFEGLKCCSSRSQRNIGEIMLEVHKLVGFLWRAFDDPDGDVSLFIDNGQIIFPSDCIPLIQDSVLRFLRSFKSLGDERWQMLLAYHCAHLMISRRGAIRSESLNFMQSVLGISQEGERMGHVCRGFLKLENVDAKVVDGVLLMSGLLMKFPREKTFDECYFMLILYFNLLQAGYIELLMSDEDDLYVIHDMFAHFFSNAQRARRFGVKNVDKKIGKAVEILKETHSKFMESDCTIPTSNALLWLVRCDLSFEKLRKENLLDKWISTVLKLARSVAIGRNTMELYEDVIRKSMNAEEKILKLTQCISLTRALRLGRDLEDAIRRKMPLETRQLPSVPLAKPSIPRPPSPVRRPPTQQIAISSQPQRRIIHLDGIAPDSFGYRDSTLYAPVPIPPVPRLHPKLSLKEKHIMLRHMNLRYQKILDIHCEIDLVPPNRSPFLTCESFVNLWTSVLLWEAKASLVSAVDAELASFMRLRVHDRRFMRAPFTVQSVRNNQNVKDNLWEVDLYFKGGSTLRKFRSSDNIIDKNLAISELHAADIVRVEVVQDGDPMQELALQQYDSVMYAVVTGITRGFVTVLLPKISASEKGILRRAVKVSRVSSLVPVQRQLEALWATNVLAEHILRTLLRPHEGWKLAKEECMKNFSMPFAIETLLQNDTINKSQAEAISAVVRKVGSFGLRCAYKTNVFRDSMLANGSLTLIKGPPGTGKTTTILSLMSALLVNGSNVLSNKMEYHKSRDFGDLAVAPFRIMVCAPSNAAVDEIVKRVMQKGLPMPNGEFASPHIVRIGTVPAESEISQVELKKLAKLDPEWSPTVSLEEEESRKKVQLLQTSLTKAHATLNTAHERRRFLEANAKNTARTNEELQAVSQEIRRSKIARDKLREDIGKERRRSDQHFNRRNQSNARAIAKVLNRASIVFSTLNGSANEAMSHMVGTFDIVIVDEAAQCLEPDIIIPFVGRRWKAIAQARGTRDLNWESVSAMSRHCVLVGDPHQLPATVLSNDHAVKNVCSKSLFERVADSPGSEVHLLDTQYRMRPEICSFPSQQFYGNLLQSGENVKTAAFDKPYHADVKKRFGPVTFLDTSFCPGTEESFAQKSTKNDGEVKLVISALTSLVTLHPNEKFVGEIVVLSPYKAQVGAVKQSIARNNILRRQDIEVSTVDGVQGREKSIVVLSTVRDGRNNSRSIGFVKDKRRMNVALTRAKHATIIIGNASALSTGSKDWRDFVDHCGEQKYKIDVHSLSDIFPEQNPSARQMQPSQRPPKSGFNANGRFKSQGSKRKLESDVASKFKAPRRKNETPGSHVRPGGQMENAVPRKPQSGSSRKSSRREPRSDKREAYRGRHGHQNSRRRSAPRKAQNSNFEGSDISGAAKEHFRMDVVMVQRPGMHQPHAERSSNVNADSTSNRSQVVRENREKTNGNHPFPPSGSSTRGPGRR